MANKTIKGLTVEIGGDTTKLGKALEGVNKKSRDLSAELGQINKLLKLDPGNTDLLAQKQKVLSDAIANTADKLDTLKEAEKQVQKQFKRGEVSEEQVRALQREIVATEQKLDSYKKAAKETAKGLDKMDESTKDVEKSSSNLGSTLGQVAKGGLKVVTGLVAAAGAALVASAEASREYRTEMGKLDTAFTTAGHSSEAATETYKALQGVLGETDQAVEAANHLAKLTKNEQDLQKWTDICTGVYATFGASLPIEGLTEAANETAKVGQVTGPLADALNWAGVSEDAFNESLAACSSEQERQTLIMETLNGLYDDAAEKYKETNAEVIRANEANEEWMAVMAEVGGAVEPLLTDIKLMGAALVQDLVPGIKEVTGAFRAMLGGDEGAGADLGEALSGIVSDVLNKITSALPQVAEMGVSLITTLGTSIIMSLPQLLSTGVQIVVTLIQGLSSAIPAALAAVRAMIPDLAQALSSGAGLILQAGVDLFLTLCQSIPQVLPVLTAQIPSIAMTVVNGLLAAIPQLIEGAVQFLDAICQAIPIICQQLAPQIAPIIATVCDGLISNIPVLLDGALQLLDAICQAIPLICEALLPEVPRIVQTLTDKLVEMTPILLDGAITLLFALIDAIPILLNSLLPEIPRIVDSVVQALIKLTPVLLQGAIKLFMSLVQAIPTVVGQLIKNLPLIITTVLQVLGELPKLVFGIGTELVKGLWNGIKDMVGWITGKLESFGDSVLSGIKNFFGIKSPSRVFKNEVGKMLAVGLADGIEENADLPIDAMSDLSHGILDEAGAVDGMALERQINHAYHMDAAASAVQATDMLGKLDLILAAIKQGQILTINGDALVGATAGTTNRVLGQHLVLAERGAV